MSYHLIFLTLKINLFFKQGLNSDYEFTSDSLFYFLNNELIKIKLNFTNLYRKKYLFRIIHQY